MKIWVGCETRNGNRPHYTGYALLVDLETGKLVGKYVPPTVFDESLPEDAIGRDSMGVRQVLQMGDEWWVGTNAGVIVLDADFKEVRRLTNDYYVGGHVLCRDEDSDGKCAWFNSTPTDSLILMDSAGRCRMVWRPLAFPEIAGPLGVQDRRKEYPDRNFRAIDEAEQNRQKQAGLLDQMHINSFQQHESGAYFTACTQKAFVRVGEKHGGVILQDDALQSPHDFTIVGDRIVVNDSGNRAVVVYDMHGTRQGVIQLHAAGSGSTSMSGWTRGLAVVDDETVWVGTTPLGILRINIRKIRVEEELRFTEDVKDSCHGLSLVRGRA